MTARKTHGRERAQRAAVCTCNSEGHANQRSVHAIIKHIWGGATGGFCDKWFGSQSSSVVLYINGWCENLRAFGAQILSLYPKEWSASFTSQCKTAVCFNAVFLWCVLFQQWSNTVLVRQHGSSAVYVCAGALVCNGTLVCKLCVNSNTKIPF